MHMIGTPLEVPVFKQRDNASVIFAFLVSENGFLLGKEIPFNARLLPGREPVFLTMCVGWELLQEMSWQGCCHFTLQMY